MRNSTGNEIEPVPFHLIAINQSIKQSSRNGDVPKTANFLHQGFQTIESPAPFRGCYARIRNQQAPGSGTAKEVLCHQRRHFSPQQHWQGERQGPSAIP